MKKAASFSLKMQVKELIFSPVIRFKPATLLMKDLIKMLLKILTERFLSKRAVKSLKQEQAIILFKVAT